VNHAEKFGAYGVQERARKYDPGRMRKRPPDLAEYPEEDAIPLRRHERQNVRQLQAEALETQRRRAQAAEGSYRVRDAAYRARMRAEAQGTADGIKKGSGSYPRGQPSSGGRTAPADRRRFGPAPDSAHNTDAIFETGARGEAYRIAQKQKNAHRSTLALLVALLIFVFLCFVGLLVYKLFFVVKEFRVEGNNRYTAEEIAGAAGVSPGDNLFSFSSRIAEEELTLRCPYIVTLKVDREIPSTVHLTVKEDEAAFYAEIYGDICVLSGGLRILGLTDRAEAEANGLIRLCLPPVQSAVNGRVLDFGSERSVRRIREILEAVQTAQLRERIDCVDLRDLRDLHMISDDCYLLDFGDSEDVALKLRVANAVLSDPLFDTTVKAKIDLTSNGSSSVVFDDQLKLER